jgi:hypothetical protein
MPSVYTIEVERTTYCITVGVDIMLSIMDKDWGDKPLYELLVEETNCHKVDYDGHFGPFVYVSIMAEYDTPKHKKKIMQIIRDYAMGVVKED